MKEVCGLNPRQSHNRYNSGVRTNPCPPDKQQDIIEAFRHFGMIGANNQSAAQGCATSILVVVLPSLSVIGTLFFLLH